MKACDNGPLKLIRERFKKQTAPMMSTKNVADRLKFANLVKNNGFYGNDFGSLYRLMHVMFTDDPCQPIFYPQSPELPLQDL